MSITAIFKPPKASADLLPAAAALRRHADEQRASQQEDAQWAAKESAAAAEVRTHETAQAILTQLEDRRVSALADREVSGASADDPDSLGADIERQRVHVARLGERARLAQAVLTRVRDKRAQLRTRQQALSTAFVRVHHAAAIEHMASIAEEFKAAEGAYLDLLVRAFGAAAAADRIASKHPHLGSAMGRLNVVDMLLPRPVNAAFSPRPDRPHLWAQIETEAERVMKDVLR
jgi:hypothetical protein